MFGKYFKIIVLIVFSFSLIQQTNALEITTNRDTYYYGDFLTIQIQVEQITEPFATIWIKDSNGKSSSPINIPINDFTTIINSPFPFESTTYPIGEYKIEIEYNNERKETNFNLLDSGKIIIPLWIKDLTKMWTNNQISDSQFAKAIEFLIKENIITVPKVPESNIDEPAIPNWVKTNAMWWSEGLIDDNTFGLGLQYMIKLGIIKI